MRKLSVYEERVYLQEVCRHCDAEILFTVNAVRMNTSREDRSAEKLEEDWLVLRDAFKRGGFIIEPDKIIPYRGYFRKVKRR